MRLFDLSLLKSTAAEDTSEVFEQLQQATLLIGHILDNLPHAIFWKDARFVFRGCNRIFAQNAGLEKPTDIIGKTDYDMPWDKDEADFYRSCDQKVMETGQPIPDIEETQRKADGSLVWIRTSKVPIFNKDKETVGVLGIFTDITEEKRQAEALRQSNANILKTQEYLVQQEKLASLGSVFEGLVEEIASPAVMVENLARAQQDLVEEASELPEMKQVPDILTDLSHNAGLIMDYAVELVKSTQRFADKELNQSLIPGQLHLAGVVKETVKLIRDTMDLKGIQIVFTEYDHSNLYGIRLELGRVFFNLINNAIEAIAEKQKAEPDFSGLIVLTLKEKDDMIVFTIQDNGVGISPDIEEKIFDPFFTTKHLGSGHQGLGLSVCQSIVYKKYGGEIQMQSFSEGTRFLVAFPG